MISDALVARLGETAARDFKDLPEWELISQEQKLWQYGSTDEIRSLKFDDRFKNWTEHRAALEAGRLLLRTITRRANFLTEPYEIKAVQLARETHEAKLRAASTGSRLRQGSFLVETDRGHLRKLRLDAVDFFNYSGDTQELATAFTSGSGSATSPAAVDVFVRNISLLEHKTDAAILAAARSLPNGTVDAGAVLRGTEALLVRLTELDEEMLRERPALDVPLRESLRLAAEWADWNESHPVH